MVKNKNQQTNNITQNTHHRKLKTEQYEPNQNLDMI